MGLDGFALCRSHGARVRYKETARFRTLKGIEALSSGRCELLGATCASRSRDETDYMLRPALERHVPEHVIITNPNSKNTVDNAYYAKRIAQRLDLKEFFLVTSRTHAIRAMTIFKRVFGDKAEIFPLDVDDNPTCAH